jgi:serine/threonine-protein kinase
LRSDGGAGASGSLLFHMSRVIVIGGTPREIARDVTGVTSWTDADQILFTSARGLEVVSSEGGDRRVVAPGSATRIIICVDALPGGRHALVTYATSGIISPSTNRLAVVSVANGDFADLRLQGTCASYAAPGYLVFARDEGEMFAAPFSLAQRKVTGAAVLLAQGQLEVATGGSSHSVSQNGTLAYVASTARATISDLFIVDPRGASRQLTREPAEYSHPRVSPDGRHVAVDVGGSIANGVGGRIYVYDIAAGTSTLVSTDSNSARPEWTRDGSRILYRQTLTDSVLLSSRPWNLSTLPTVVARAGEQSFYEVALGSPGGLAAIRHGSAGPGAIVPTRIVLAPTESLGVSRPLFDRVASIVGLGVSPNGRLLAYASNESRRAEVYVTPIPGPGPRVQVSVNGGAEPVWSRHGKVLYFRSPYLGAVGPVMAAGIVEQPELAVTRRDSLFADTYVRSQTLGNYDVFPDGRFVMVRSRTPSGAARDRLFVIVNWPQLIEKRGAMTER